MHDGANYSLRADIDGHALPRGMEALHVMGFEFVQQRFPPSGGLVYRIVSPEHNSEFVHMSRYHREQPRPPQKFTSAAPVELAEVQRLFTWWDV